MTPLQDKLKKLLYECAIHKKRIVYAYNKIKNSLPFSVDTYKHLSDEAIEHIDQFLFRFSKLQDVMGDKLFVTTLLLLEENIKEKPFIDMLNRMESLGLLYRDDWLLLRKIRNSVAHEYGFNVADMVESLNAIYNSCNKLLKVHDNIARYCTEKFDFLNN